MFDATALTVVMCVAHAVFKASNQTAAFCFPFAIVTKE